MKLDVKEGRREVSWKSLALRAARRDHEIASRLVGGGEAGLSWEELVGDQKGRIGLGKTYFDDDMFSLFIPLMKDIQLERFMR